MKVRFSPRARRRAATVNKWWRANRSAAPDLFDRELTEATLKLAATPAVGAPYGTINGRPVMRVLLPKTEQHLYYAVDEAAAVVGVITIWGARRGRPPKL